MTRTVLTAPLTVYFAPGGSDATGDGSLANPWATPAKAWAVLKSGYDLSGQSVVIQQKAPGTVHCAASFTGRIVGQTGEPSQVIVQGSTTNNPLDADAYVWSPPPSGAPNTAFTATLGASLTVTGFKFDNIYAITTGAGVIEAGIFINVGDDVNLHIGTVVYGFNGGQAWLNVAVKSYCLIYGNTGIWPATATATAANLDTTSSQFSISGIGGGAPIIPGSGVHGTGIASGSYVISYAAGVVTMNQPPSANGTNVAVSFSDFVLGGFGIGEFAYMTNGSNGYVSMTGNVRSIFGFLNVDNVGVMNWAYIPVFQKETLQPMTGTGLASSAQITLSTTAGIATGFTVHGILTSGAPIFKPDTKIISIDDATHVTLNKSPYVNFTSAAIRIGYAPAQFDGPKVTAWMNSTINIGGNQSLLSLVPGTSPLIGDPNRLGSISTGSQVQ